MKVVTSLDIGSNTIRAVTAQIESLDLQESSSDSIISIIGVNLDKKGEKLAKKIVELGRGKLYIVKDAKNVDKIILEDYYSIYSK